MMWQFGELGYDFSINYPCGNDGCRTDPKPIKWDYFNDGNRRNLYKVFQALINLKKDYPAFNSSNHTMKLNTFAKRLTILDPTMNVNVIGNFAVVANNINPEFPDTGWWYDFFSGDSIFVNNVTDVIPLLPGEFHIYTTVKLPAPEEGILSGIEGASGETVTDYRLEQNYPNPFNPSTTIKFDVADFGLVNLKVYDVLGNEVATLINKELPAGNYRVTFDASQLASGVYIYRLRAGGFIVSKKMILLK